MGQGKAYKPNDEDKKLIVKLALSGVQQKKIAEILGIAFNTLRKHYADELDSTTSRANATVAASLYDMATKGKNVTAAIFWLKTRAQWKETAPEGAETNVYQVNFTRAPDRPSSKKKSG